MTQQDFTNAFIYLLSGSATMKNDKEMEWEDEYGSLITIEFPTNTPTRAIVRKYWKSGGRFREVEYRYGLRNGFHLGWYKNGEKHWEMEYQDGKQKGECLFWGDDGKILEYY